MKQKEEKKKKIRELKSYVEFYNEDRINDWFKENLKSKGQAKDYANLILNENYFFYFSSQSLNKELLINESKKRHFAILKNFDWKEQLLILRNVYFDCDVTIDYFNYMDLKNKRVVNLIKKDDFFGRIINKWMNKEDFTQIENFLCVFGEDLLKIQYDCLVYNHKDRYSYGSKAIDCSGVGSFFTDDIIFNYSKEKESFLERHNIKIPSRERCDEFEMIIYKNDYLNKDDKLDILRKIKEYNILNFKRSVENLLLKNVEEDIKINYKSKKI